MARAKNKSESVAETAVDFAFPVVDGVEIETEVGTEGIPWVPHFVEMSEADKNSRRRKMKNGTVETPYIAGEIVQARAFGRVLYFVDAPTSTGQARIMLPEHGALFNALAKVRLGATIGIHYAGRDPNARANEQATHMYTLHVPKAAQLTTERVDAARVKFSVR